MSDCATHNGPAYENGKCNCGVDEGDKLRVSYRIRSAFHQLLVLENTKNDYIKFINTLYVQNY